MARHGWKPTPEMVAKQRATMIARAGSPRDRLIRNVEYDTNGGCWLWSGTILSRTGYGQIQVAGLAIGAHRLSYELFRGPIPNGFFICHRCDVRSCVNPDHLFVGSHADNMADMVRKGRAASPKGEAASGAKITEADIPKILARLLIGQSCAEVAADYGVTDCAINAIRRGKSWNHVTGLPRMKSVKFRDSQGGAGANNPRVEAV